MLARSNNRTLLLIIMVLLVTNGIMLYLLNRTEKKAPEPELTRSQRTIKMVQTELGLDSTQVLQYIALRGMRDSLLKPVQAEMRENKMAIMALLNKPEVDSVALASSAQKVGNNQAQIEMEYFYHFRRMAQMLNPDQLPKFDSLMYRMVNRSTGQDNQNKPTEKNQK
ncbi:MAG: hypothetical protein MUE71_07540 [Chitinophagaceae bacterium]|jgi:Spy/CpxP family protein refolding chaperone|nr:hypothetical protein [Chitinophagaceae bacterium]